MAQEHTIQVHALASPRRIYSALKVALRRFSAPRLQITETPPSGQSLFRAVIVKSLPLQSLDELSRLRERYGGAPIVAFCLEQGHIPILAALSGRDLAAIMGPSEMPEKWHQVIERVARGERLLPLTPYGRLTRRELDVLALLARGATNREIVRELGVSMNTVKTHLQHILRKLRANSRTQAVLRVMAVVEGHEA